MPRFYWFKILTLKVHCVFNIRLNTPCVLSARSTWNAAHWYNLCTVVHCEVLIPLCVHSIVCRQLVTYDGGSQWGVDTPVCPQHCMPPIGHLWRWFTVRCWYPCVSTTLYAANWSLMTVVHSEVLIPLCVHNIVCRQLVTYDGGSQWGVDTPVCPQHCMPSIGQLSWWFTVRCWYPLCVHNIVCRQLVSYPGGSQWGVDTPVCPQHCMPPIGQLSWWFTVRCWYPCVSTTLYAANWSLIPVVHSEVFDTPVCPQHCMPSIGHLWRWFTVRCWYPCVPTTLYAVNWSLIPVVHSEVLIPLCAHNIVCRQLVTYDGGSQWGVDTPVCPQHCMPSIGHLWRWFTVRKCWYPCVPTSIVCRQLVTYDGGSQWGVDTPVCPQHCMPSIGHLWRWFTVRCWYPCVPTALYAVNWSLMTVVHSEVLIPLCAHNIVCRQLVTYDGGSLWGVDTPVHPQHCMPPIGHLWRWFTVRCWYLCVPTTLYAANWSLMTFGSLWGVDTPVCPQHCMPPIGHLWRWFTVRCWYPCVPTALYAANWSLMTVVHCEVLIPLCVHNIVCRQLVTYPGGSLWGVDTPVCPQHCMPPIGHLWRWFTVRCWYPCAPTTLYAANWSLMTVVHSEVLIPLCAHSIVCRQLVTYDGGSLWGVDTPVCPQHCMPPIGHLWRWFTVRCWYPCVSTTLYAANWSLIPVVHSEVLIPLCVHNIVCRQLVTYDVGSLWGVDTPVCPQHCMPPVGHLWRWFQGGCTCA